MTHAVRSVFAHFLGLDRLYAPFIGSRLTREQLAELRAQGRQLFVGHVEREMEIEQAFKDAIIVLAIRDPLTQVHSMVGRVLSPDRPNAFARHIRQELASVEAAYHYTIFGGQQKGVGRLLSMRHNYEKIALAWLHRADLVLRFEDLRSPTAEATMLAGLRRLFGDALPHDAAERVRAGLDPSVSASFSGARLTGDAPQLPVEDIINVVMPGMRKALGYCAD